jgi:hypothetical protein
VRGALGGSMAVGLSAPRSIPESFGVVGRDETGTLFGSDSVAGFGGSRIGNRLVAPGGSPAGAGIGVLATPSCEESASSSLTELWRRPPALPLGFGSATGT